MVLDNDNLSAVIFGDRQSFLEVGPMQTQQRGHFDA